VDRLRDLQAFGKHITAQAIELPAELAK